jgi:hypothetical protein
LKGRPTHNLPADMLVSVRDYSAAELLGHPPVKGRFK